MKQLRPYQTEARTRVHGCSDNVVVHHPTGSGKSVLLTALAKDFADEMRSRVLVLSPRQHITHSLYSDLAHMCRESNLELSLEQGGRHGNTLTNLVLGSIMSLKGERLNEWPRNHFQYILADECHHATSDTYRNILEHFSDARIVGFSATPNRPSSIPEERLRRIVHTYPIRQAIEEGYLAQPVIKKAGMKMALQEVRITAGDLSAKDLDRCIQKQLAPYVEALRDSIEGQTLIFVPTIATAEMVKKGLEFYGIKCATIHSKISNRDQRSAIDAFAAKEINVLINPASLTEGWNMPCIDTVIIGRPTHSLRLLTQMIGRGLRPKGVDSPGTCNIVEFEHDAQIGKVLSTDILFFDPDMSQDMLDHLRMFMIRKTGHSHPSVMSLIAVHEQLIKEGLEKYLGVTLRHPTVGKIMLSFRSAFDYQKAGDIIPERKWSTASINDKITAKQEAYLERFGIRCDDNTATKYEASLLISSILADEKSFYKWRTETFEYAQLLEGYQIKP